MIQMINEGLMKKGGVNPAPTNQRPPPPPPQPPAQPLKVMRGKLELWKNHNGWQWLLDCGEFRTFPAPDRRYHSRSDARTAAHRIAAQLNLIITETIVR